MKTLLIMKTLLLSFFTILLISSNLFSQVTTNPSLPTDDASVTITFDASQGSAGLKDHTGDVYAHTGVITDESTGDGDWQYVIAGWTENTTKAKMTSQGGNIYTLEITPDIRTFYGVPAGEVIEKMAFVFRSADGSKTGKTSDGGDIFINVYESGLAVAITDPTEENFFVDASTNFNIQIEASEATSVTVQIDGSPVHTETSSPNSFIYAVNAAASGKHEIKVIATDGTDTKEDIKNYIVRQNSPVQALPAGVVDGINYIDETTVTLVLHAPYKTSAYVIGSFNDWEIDPDNYLMKRTSSSGSATDVRYWITLTGLTAGQEYIFQYLVDENIKIADPYTEKTSDPWMDHYITNTIYPNLIDYPTGKTTGIASTFQTNQTAYNWQVPNFTSPEVKDLVIYELWVGNFTTAEDYQSVINKIDYFKELGVNAIELMPINEFEGNDSWGYNPSFYFAVDKAYGTKDKLKEFIDVCHQNGIAVIIDMVLNHSFGQSPFVQLYFDADAGQYGQPTSENIWFNQVAKHPYNVGYDFNHESTHTRNLSKRVVEFWLNEYKVDGYRFDLSKGFTQVNSGSDVGYWGQYDASRIAIWKDYYDKIVSVNPNAYVILEHLSDNSEETELSAYGFLMWGNMNGKYSGAAKGNNSGDDSDLSWGFYDSRSWADNHLITYMESHDEERLMYEAITNGTGTSTYNIREENTALARMELDALFFFTIPGPKMIWQFGELGYDISINVNGRTGKKPVKWDYYDVTYRKRLFQIYSYLIKLKKEHDVFETSTFTKDVVGSNKSIHLTGSDMKVAVLGNFSTGYTAMNPNFQNTGTWYEYFSGDELNVTNVAATIELEPGEYRLYTTVKLDKPELVSVKDVNEGNESNVHNINLSVFPNPTSDYVYIGFSNTKNIKNLNADIYNISGKKVNSYNFGNFNSGVSKLRFDLKNNKGNKLSSGTYYINMYSNNFKKNTKIIIK